ncbi:MAG TPA: nitrous oxide reductase accessory protein NosL [Chitinophagaceae bacterium]
MNSRQVFMFFIPRIWLLTAFTSCSTKLQPIKVGTDICYYCKMIVSDEKFGGEILTGGGEILKFDDSRCLVSFIRRKKITDIRDIYLVDFSNDHKLLNIKTAILVQGKGLRGPMNGDMVAFADRITAEKECEKYSGHIVSWNDIIK